MNIAMLLISFAGGVFGATIGGTISFVFTGIIALMGTAILLATGDTTVLDVVAFGPFFGPHIAFAGGVAASAYAGVKKDKLKSEGNDLCQKYVEGYDCAAPNFPSGDLSVLIIGGVFGVIGYLINELVIMTGIKVDTIAVAVVGTGLLSRFIVARDSLVGDYDDEVHKINPLFTFIWGTSAGLLTAMTVLAIDKAFGIDVSNIGWAISAVSLIFIYTNVQGFPASHHITLNAGLFVTATGNIWVAAIAGGITGILGDYINKYTNTEVGSHLDMPAITIVIGSFIALTLLS